MKPAFGIAALLLASSASHGSERPPIPRASERYESRDPADTPDFQRHVVPLLSRMGCNGRACHGSFQGQGELQLSLFGYDFQRDHRALTREKGDSGEFRVDLDSPDSSLVLRKPLEEIDHEGGQKFEPGSWQHHLLLRWIESGARGTPSETALEGLEVTPGEILFGSGQESETLRVVAVWSDGTREDVTCLSRFRVNDDSVATVSEAGIVTSVAPGDTHVVAFYDKGVTAVPVIRPFGTPGRSKSRIRAPIDRHISAKLNKLGLEPSGLCTDEEFLRRISLDLCGTLPAPAEVVAFLEDDSPRKRAHKIEELLGRPTYAAWWANKFCDYTGNNPRQQPDFGQELAVQWYHWILDRLERNVPYDELVAGIVLATGRKKGTSYRDYAGEMTSYFRIDDRVDFASRETMPHYWGRRSLEKPADKALAFAHSFLGLQLQCAQCHKHPFDQWSKNDFEQFTRIFEPIQFGVAPDGMREHQAMAQAFNGRMQGGMMMRMSMDMLGMAEEGKAVPWKEVYIAKGNRPSNISLLGLRDIDLNQHHDPRRHLLDWMTEADNPYFARAFVNRVWANYFGAGIIHPPDDLNRANPPSNAALLDHLEQGFVSSGYDIKWLHREIVSSDAYQRSWRPNHTNETDRRNFSRMLARRIPAEVVYDALAQVTAADSEMDTVRTNLERRAIGHLSMRMAGTYAMNIFGKPDRATNCDCERSDGTSLLQAVFLKNDPILRNRLSRSEWLAGIETRFGDNPPDPTDRLELVEQAYLRCLGRFPTQAEIGRAERHFAESPGTRATLEDLLWALVNTKEFLMNH